MTKTDTTETTEAEETPAPKFHECRCFSVWDELTGAYVSCGTEIPIKRTFHPGHDAKYKSVLLKAFRAGEAFSFIDGGVRVDANPMELARERNWEKFMTPAKAKKLKAKTKDATETPEGKADRPDDVEPASMAGFHPARFKVGRWMKDGNIVSRNEDGTVTVSYADGKGKTQTLTLDASKVEEG